ncbi:RES domain-containing protein [Pseudomonas sp. PB101]|jgi:RES domain-containing protein|nr:RES domain-containing protein [Pseudomonas sp. PB101]
MSGIGAELGGGRWNIKGMRAVYTSLDSSTAILEVAVHKGFRALDCEPHTLTAARLRLDIAPIYRVVPSDIPNPNWLIPGHVSWGQQQYGTSLLEQHPFVILPSTVSRHSMNLIINPELAKGMIEVVLQEPFALDGRLNLPNS